MTESSGAVASRVTSWTLAPERVVTAPEVRSSVQSLMILTGVWTLVLGAIGVYITKILTFPLGH